MPLPGAQKQSSAIGQQPDFARVVQRLGQPAPEVVAKRVHHLLERCRCEPSAAKLTEGEKLQDIHG